MKELEDLAEQVRNQLNLDYDTESVKFIADFIERQRNNLDNDQRQGLVNSLGSFIGQCIIKNYGGRWQVDRDTQAVCIALNDQNKIFPFAKTAKQMENGLEDSVFAFYTIIPTLFNISPLMDSGESSKLQSTNQPARVRKWWKFW